MQILLQIANILSLEILLMNRLSPPILCSFESWLYKGGKNTKSEHRGYQQLNTSPGVDDPVGHRLGNWGIGVGTYAACFCVFTQYLYFSTILNHRLTAIHTLDDLYDLIGARGFGNSIHDGTVLVIILFTNPTNQVYSMFGSMRH